MRWTPLAALAIVLVGCASPPETRISSIEQAIAALGVRIEQVALSVADAQASGTIDAAIAQRLKEQLQDVLDMARGADQARRLGGGFDGMSTADWMGLAESALIEIITELENQIDGRSRHDPTNRPYRADRAPALASA